MVRPLRAAGYGVKKIYAEVVNLHPELAGELSSKRVREVMTQLEHERSMERS